MATHSSILAWRIPWTEEPGRLYGPRGHKESDTTERLTLLVSFIIQCKFPLEDAHLCRFLSKIDLPKHLKNI